MADHLTNYLPLVVVKVIFQVDVENIVVYYDVVKEQKSKHGNKTHMIYLRSLG